MGEGRKNKYPVIGHNYESLTHPGLFFAGTNTHSLDHRKSAGGFIHGFRYTCNTATIPKRLIDLLPCSTRSFSSVGATES